MKIKELVSHIAEQEGKISEVSVGNIREIIGIISDVLYSDIIQNNDTYLELFKNGERRT